MIGNTGGTSKINKYSTTPTSKTFWKLLISVSDQQFQPLQQQASAGTMPQLQLQSWLVVLIGARLERTSGSQLEPMPCILNPWLLLLPCSKIKILTHQMLSGSSSEASVSGCNKFRINKLVRVNFSNIILLFSPWGFFVLCVLYCLCQRTKDKN